MSTEARMDLRELYDRVADLPPAERADWLRQHCPDEALRARVQRLLEATGVDPLAQSPQQRLSALESPPLPATEVGGFRLIRPIGQGGMATVWLAERIGFEQRVAVKLLHRTLVSDFDRQLFERERRVLASLEHPNIARLIDGGIGANLQPWLAMEYVEGENLLDYARSRRLQPRARVALLLEVCEAVAAAHAQLVVHRDLKPGNVLVGADGRVKLLDFGIAKVLADEADLTAGGYAAFTPAYAAPEQLRGQATSTATDVHALGVMAIELLLGLRPADLHRLPASQQALLSPEDQPTTRRELARFLRGDLDKVLRKCIDEDPRCRYPGAQALADDLRRFLEDQPVTAHPPSRWYLLRKFARRHRGGVVVTAVLSLATLASLVLALWMGGQAREQARVAQAERERAEAALKVSESTEGFVFSLFGSTVRSPGAEAAPSGRDILLKAETEIEDQFAAVPEVAVRLYGRLALVHAMARAPDDQKRLLGKARVLAEAKLPADAETRRAAVFAEASERAANQDAAALEEMRAVIEATPASDRSPPALSRRNTFGMRLLMAGEVDEGIEWQLSTLAPLREQCAEGMRAQCEFLFGNLRILATMIAARRPEQARDLAEQAVAEARRIYGDTHPRTSEMLDALARLEARLGNPNESLKALTAAGAINAQARAERLPGMNADDFASRLWDQGKLLFVVETHRRLLAGPAGTGQELPAAARRVHYAAALQQVGRYQQAQSELERARAELEADPERFRTELASWHLVRAQIAAEHDRDGAAALAEGRKALARLRESAPVVPQELAGALIAAHRAATLNGAQQEAETWLAELRSLMAGIASPTPDLRRAWLLRQAQIALSEGDLVVAERHCASLLAELADYAMHATRDSAQLLALQIAAAQGKPSAADPAWLTDVERRRGAESRLVRDALVFGPR